jgi:hypothetical protein
MEAEENKLLELLSKESKEILKEQIKSYRNAKAKSSILAITNFIFLLLSFFLIELSTDALVLFFTFIPFFLFIISFILILIFIIPTKIYYEFNEQQFDKIINMDYYDFLLYIIGSNKASISSNNYIINKKNKIFKISIKFTIIGIILFFITFLFNFIF